jgi:hypothetical protein
MAEINEGLAEFAPDAPSVRPWAEESLAFGTRSGGERAVSSPAELELLSDREEEAGDRRT